MEFNYNIYDDEGVDSITDNGDQNLEYSAYDIDILESQEQEVLNSRFTKKTVFEIALDSEFITSTKTNLSLQVHIKTNSFSKPIDTKFIILNQIYQKDIDSGIISKFSYDTKCKVYYEDLTGDLNLLIKYILITLETEYNIRLDTVCNFEIYLYFYFSAKDLLIAFGLEMMLPYFLNRKPGFYRRRNHGGVLDNTYYTLTSQVKSKIFLKDLFGMDSGSLDSLIESCGLDTTSKRKLDISKTNMSEPLVNKTYDYLDYAINDASVLFTILETKLEVYNNILKNTYNITDEKFLFTKKNLPITIGSTVNKMFDKFYHYIILKNDPLNMLAHAKQSILSLTTGRYSANLEILEKLNNCFTLEDLSRTYKHYLNTEEDLMKIYSTPKPFKYTTLEYASKKYLLDISVDNTLATISLTSGGRTVNERPEEITCDYGADADFPGAYGRNIEESYMPVGRPHYISYTPNETKRMKLGEFMKKIVPKTSFNLWKVVVSGKLTFEQDLIFSKVFATKNLYNKILSFDDSNVRTFEIPGTFALLRKEIYNGSITSSLWDIITKVANHKELSEFNNLEVVAGIYYLEKDRVNSIEDLTKSFLEDRGSYKFNTKLNCLQESRTHTWFSIPLSNLVTPLINERVMLKNKKDSFSLAKQVGLKNIINTLYGVITSRFFSINNVVVAENITSKTRGNVWLLAKSLNTFLSITDGGPFSLQSVNFIRSDLPSLKLPGIHILSYYKYFNHHRSFISKPLGDINWKYLFDNNTPPEKLPDVGCLALDHIKKFWSHYKIEITFGIEIKMYFKRAAYINKAHYYFITYDEVSKTYIKPFHKIRGFHYNEKQILNPVFLLLKHCAHHDLNNPANDKFNIQNDGIYEERKLIHINEWRKSIVKVNNKFISKYGYDFMPDDELVLLFEYRLNNTHFPIMTIQEFLKRNRRTLAKINYINNQEIVSRKQVCFEAYLHLGIKLTLTYMKSDDLRSKTRKTFL